MPTTIVPIDAFTTPVTSVADGEDLNQGNLAAAVQQLGNRTLYNANRVGGFRVEAIQGGADIQIVSPSFIVDTWLTITSLTLPPVPSSTTAIAHGIFKVGINVGVEVPAGRSFQLRLALDGNPIGPVAETSIAAVGSVTRFTL